MRLLVSVRDVREGADALAGGADVIDVKEPARGALGMADVDTARAIARRIGARRPVSIVIGDLTNPLVAAQAAQCATAVGASIVKVGLAGVESQRRARDVIRAVISGARPARVAIVAYGDAARTWSPEAERVLEIALLEGADGVVLDTFDKKGPTLLAQLPWERLTSVARDAHAAKLFVGLAGKLGREHIGVAQELGAELFGVRSAVCDSGRAGRLSRARVAELALVLRQRRDAQLATQSA